MGTILDRIKKGKLATPERIVMYGVEGIGKSTWAGKAPRPIFLCAEDGLPKTMIEQERLTPKTFPEFQADLNAVRRDAHEYKTLVIDTEDFLEQLIADHVSATEGGYEKNFGSESYQCGVKSITREIKLVASTLDRIVEERGMDIIILAHAAIKNQKDPGGTDFDRYVMKGYPAPTGFLREWADIVLFAKHDVYFSKKGRTAKAIAEARVIFTTWSRGWDAKNRHGLPWQVPLDAMGGYAAFAKVMAEGLVKGSSRAKDVAEEVIELMASAVFKDEETKAKTIAWLGGEPLDPAKIAEAHTAAKLMEFINRLQTMQPPKDGSGAPAAQEAVATAAA
ncbi:MAG: AAA family ATPase [Opitutaceae bacterium]